MNLKQAEENQRSKQLDAREKWIVEKEKLLDEKALHTQVDILDEQIRIKEGIVATIERRIDKLTNDFTTTQKANKDAVEGLADQEDNKLKRIDLLQKEAEKIEGSIKDAKKRLLDIKDAIKAQQAYFDEQEKTVNNAIAEWNDQLTTFTVEADQIEARKKTLLVDIINAEKEIQPVQNKIEDTKTELTNLKEAYTEKVIIYKDTLGDWKVQIQDAQDELTKITEKSKARLAVILSRENELDIREATINKKELDISTRERALETKLGLSQIQL